MPLSPPAIAVLSRPPASSSIAPCYCVATPCSHCSASTSRWRGPIPALRLFRFSAATNASTALRCCSDACSIRRSPFASRPLDKLSTCLLAHRQRSSVSLFNTLSPPCLFRELDPVTRERPVSIPYLFSAAILL